MRMAQTQDALHAAIMAQLLANPDTAQIPPAQLQQVVDALAREAQTQKVSAQEIAWRPQIADVESPTDTSHTGSSICPSGFERFCSLSEGFGFVGADITIPVALFVIAGTLFLVLRRMHHHHILEHGAPVSQS